MIQPPSAWQTLLGEDFSHYFRSMLLCLCLDDWCTVHAGGF